MAIKVYQESGDGIQLVEKFEGEMVGRDQEGDLVFMVKEPGGREVEVARVLEEAVV